MKKISEWLNELPEPYRTQAIENFKEQGFKDDICNRLSIALNLAFEWADSPQKKEYWYNLFIKI